MSLLEKNATFKIHYVWGKSSYFFVARHIRKKTAKFHETEL